MSVKRSLHSFNIDMFTMSWTLRPQAPSNMHTTGNNNGRQRMLRVTMQRMGEICAEGLRTMSAEAWGQQVSPAGQGQQQTVHKPFSRKRCN